MLDISTLQNQFQGDIVTPLDATYEESIKRWASNAKRRAKVVAFVKNEADVGLALEYARVKKLPIAVRGGGHSAGGSSSTEGGLVIDLSRYLNQVRIEKDKKLAYVSGGALWETVDKAAIKYGLASVAGTVNHTGVGGLLLGGGFGWLSPAHGLVIDNLVQATIVTADGRVLIASNSENTDLFFAIRGGGGNFGVATEFVLRLHQQRATVYAGAVVFTPEKLEKLTELTAKWFDRASSREAMLHNACVTPDGNPCIAICLFYNGSEAEGRENYKAFFDLGPIMDKSREIPYEEVNTLQNHIAFPGQGIYLKSLAQRKPHFPSIFAAHNKIIDICKSTPFKASLIFDYLPLQKIRSVPDGMTAFRREEVVEVFVLMTWKAEEDEEGRYTDQARVIAHEIAEIVHKGQQKMLITESESLGYSNYDFDVFDGKSKMAFGANYPRLQRIKKRYDPENVFNKWFPITPA
ncbi:FAD binding domain-containing protein [Tricholoma matsutake]|nr:FAD binding domain-containing protein [Tricholoma matsutake 945]